MSIDYERPKPRPGHVIAAAGWKWDGKRFRLQQVHYEIKKRREREPEQPASARQSLLI